MAVRRRRAGGHSRVRLTIVRTGKRLTVLGAGDTTQRSGVISANLPCVGMRSIAHSRSLTYPRAQAEHYCQRQRQGCVENQNSSARIRPLNFISNVFDFNGVV